VQACEARAYEEGGAAVDRAREDIKATVGTVRVEGVLEGGGRYPTA